ncbi:hypothetical protein KKF61_02095 [Patescibacteria group bacterium]|nr:hypothetical protein [Patescibacteria group bacterium]
MLKLSRISIAFLAVLMVFAFSFPAGIARAAALTNVKDTLSTLTASTAANHEIVFTTPTGVAAAETFTVTFPASFASGLNGIDFADIDVNDGGEKTLAAVCSDATWGAAVAVRTITFTSCTDTIDASDTVTIEIGLNAAAGDTQIVNPVAANNLNIDIAGTMTDSGSLGISIIADDSVAVTAQVDPSITFTISDVAVGFGDLSASTGRWATTGGGGDASEIMPTAGHTMTVATNADNGWAITYNGATLTSGANTITVASIDEDSDGAPGSEEFGISASTDLDATIASGYERDATADFAFVAGTTTTLVSEIVPTATETITVSYLANIAGNTEAGNYSTAITYIATATF